MSTEHDAQSLSRNNYYGQYDLYGPFGASGHEVGNFAVSMLDELLEPKAVVRPIAWDDGDARAVNMLEMIDTGVKFIHSHPETDGEDIAVLHRTFLQLRNAVPLSESERGWLWLSKPRRTLEDMTGEAAEIMSGGVLRVVQGRELVRRWWAWRRETDEFAEQGSLREARQALGELATTLLPNESERPAMYESVMTRL